jgi:DoxX-like family
MTQSTAPAHSHVSRTTVIIGYALTGLAALFLAFDTAVKLLGIEQAVEATTALGYPASVVMAIGIIELVCLTLYLVPATSVFGAILLVGYLGGAVATHVRVGNPLASHVLFPVYIAAMLWGGLYLREPRLRGLLPLRR